MCPERAGVFVNMQFMTPERSTLTYEMPLAEVVTDFFDELKSRSKGYASMEYSFLEYREEDLVKLDVKINGELAEPLATICHRCACRIVVLLSSFQIARHNTVSTAATGYPTEILS